MLFLLIVIWVVPPLVSVLLYERFRGYELSIFKRVSLGLIFAFFITLVGYSALWFRGWQYQNWTLDAHSTMTGITFTVKYMAVAIVTAVILPYLVCLLRAAKVPEKKADAKNEDVDSEDDENSSDS